MVMHGWFVCQTVSMVTTIHATGLEKTIAQSPSLATSRKDRFDGSIQSGLILLRRMIDQVESNCSFSSDPLCGLNVVVALRNNVSRYFYFSVYFSEDSENIFSTV